MSTLVDQNAVAVYAAGIAHSLASARIDDAVAQARNEYLAKRLIGHDGEMEIIAEAAECMERFRVCVGVNAAWGCKLPPLYDVWDAIATTLMTRFDDDSLEDLIYEQINRMMAWSSA